MFALMKPIICSFWPIDKSGINFGLCFVDFVMTTKKQMGRDWRSRGHIRIPRALTWL